MGYRIHFDNADGIVEIKLSGKWTKENLDTLTCNGIGLPNPEATKILIDIREIEERLGMAEAFNSVVKFPVEQRLRKTALLDREENIKVVALFEIAAENRGIPVKWFSAKEDALVWLRS